jgi:hypothetical protein
LSTVLPPIVINLLLGGREIKWIAETLMGRETTIAHGLLGPMFITFLLPAIFAATLWAVLQLATSNQTRRHCGILLLSYVALSAIMLMWPLLPIPWQAIGLSGAAASRLEDFSWSALLGLFLMERWAVFPHALVLVVLWFESLFYGRRTLRALASK